MIFFSILQCKISFRCDLYTRIQRSYWHYCWYWKDQPQFNLVSWPREQRRKSVIRPRQTVCINSAQRFLSAVSHRTVLRILCSVLFNCKIARLPIYEKFFLYRTRFHYRDPLNLKFQDRAKWILEINERANYRLWFSHPCLYIYIYKIRKRYRSLICVHYIMYNIHVGDTLKYRNTRIEFRS